MESPGPSGVDVLSLSPSCDADDEQDEELDVETVYSSDLEDVQDDAHSLQQGAGAAAPTDKFFQVLCKAMKELDISLPPVPVSATSLFDEGEGQRRVSAQIPLLPDFKNLVCEKFGTPVGPKRHTSTCKKYSNMAEKDQIACGPLPLLDRTLLPLVSPSSSMLGKATCPSKNCKQMDVYLGRLHKAISTQTCLLNTSAILALYMRRLTVQLQQSPGDQTVLDDLQGACSSLANVIKEQAEVSGITIASFWTARRHLWLSQSRLHQQDRDGLLRLPVDPTAMFGPDAMKLLQQAHEGQQCARDVYRSSARRGRGPRPAAASASASVPHSHGASWGPGDLRPQLEALRASRRQGRGGHAGNQRSSKKPPPS